MSSWMLKEVVGDEAKSVMSLDPNNSYILGRKPGSFIRLVSSFASRQHCTIIIRNNNAFIIDHKTLNGTFINTNKILTDREISLKSGDLIGIGVAPSEYSLEPHFAVYQANFDPNVTEIQDTCEATLVYVDNQAAPAPKKTDKDCFLESGIDLLRQDNVFKVPPPLTRSLSISKIKRENVTIDTEEEQDRLENADSVSSYEKKMCKKLPDCVKSNVSVPLPPSKNVDDVLVNHIIDPSPSSSGGSENNHKSRHEYSICDDIIIIDSDVDEDDLPCSQFFNVSKRETEELPSEDAGDFQELSDQNLFRADIPIVDLCDEGVDEPSRSDPFEKEACINLGMNEEGFDALGAVNIHEEPELFGDEEICKLNLLIHSQLSPETYLSRVNNQNKVEDVDRIVLSGSDNLLEALMTQMECDIQLQNIAEFLPLEEDLKKNLSSSGKKTECLPSKTEHQSLLTSSSKIKTATSISPKQHLSENSVKPSSDTKHKTKHSSKRKSSSCSEADEPKIKSSRTTNHSSTHDYQKVLLLESKVHLKSERPKTRYSITKENQINKIVEAGRKLEGSILAKKHTTRVVQEPYNLRPSEKKKIRDIRKKKLQEVALKEKLTKTSEAHSTKMKVETAAPEYGKSFVKNTDKNRGAVLINMLPEKPQVKKNIKKEVKVEASKTDQTLRKTRSKSRAILSDDIKTKSMANKNIEGIKKPEETSKIVKRTSLRNITNHEKIQVSEKAKKDTKQDKEKSSAKEVAPKKRKSILKNSDSTYSNNRVKFAPKNQLTLVKYYDKEEPDTMKNLSHRKVVYVRGSPKSADVLLYFLCKWNSKWIEESMHTDGLPPLLGNEFPTPSPVVASYESFQEYQNTLLPLQIFELWDNIIRQVSQKNQVVSVGGVRSTEESQDKMMEILSVTSFMRAGDGMQKQGDFVIVKGVDRSSTYNKTNTKQPVKTNMWLSFGFIPHQPVKKPLQHSDPASINYFNALCASGGFDKKKAGQIYTVNFNVRVRAKTKKFWRPGIEISLVTCVNLMGDLKLFQTLERLIFSPLSPLILNPNSFQPVENVSDYPFHQQQSLNPEQMNAVNYCTRMALGSQASIALIHGPPGTGKSSVITHLLLTILDELRKHRHQMRLLVCASSNFAIDQLVSRLLSIRQKLGKNKFNMVRVGNNDMMSDEAKLISLKTLSEKMIDNFSKPEISKLEIEKLGKREKYLKSLLKSGCSKEDCINQEIIDNKRYVRELQLLSGNKADKGVRLNLIKRFEKEILLKCHIVATTLSSSVSSSLQQHLSTREAQPFGCCIVDEATQATELQTLLPILLNVNKFVLVGDDKQLSPFVMSQKAKADGLEVSLFERFLNCWKTGEVKHAPIFPLVRQYRMHSEIATFPNECFYSGQLKSERPQHNINCLLAPYLIFNHTFLQQADGNSNSDEGDFVIRLVSAVRGLKETEGLSIGIITPYQNQKELLIRALRVEQMHKSVSVMTVDSAQGQERDIIVFSCVRTNNIGFMADSHRLNVALTRAKHALYVVANFTSLRENKVWRDLLSNAYSRKLVVEVNKVHSALTIKKFIMKTSH